MNNKDSNRMNMIGTTVDYCEANATATAGITAYAGVITAIKGKLVLINGLNQIGTGAITGVTIDMRLVRSTMSDIAMKCASATMAYANSINNNTLKALVDYSRTELDRMKKEDVDDVCEAIHDATDANIAAVTPFGAAASDVSDLQAAIGLYRTAMQNPRQALITKGEAIEHAKEMVRLLIADLLVGQLDVMTNTLKTANPEFVSGYYRAREVIDLGSTSAKVRGTVLDINDTPLRYVRFTITKADDGTEVGTTETDIKGKFGISQLPMGDFNFKWELAGYKTVEERDAHIGPGKELNRKIVMEAAIVREGQFIPGKIDNIDLNGVDESITKVTIEALGTSIQVFGSNGAGNGPNGNVLGLSSGQVLTKNPVELANETSFMQNGNNYLNVQNTGGIAGGWRITFEK